MPVNRLAPILLLFLGAPFLAAESTLPNEHLLFNGWGITPTGQQEQVSDMPLKIVVAPDNKAAFAVCAGYNKPGLAVIALAEQKVTGFIDLPQTWQGLAFDLAGKRLFVS